MNAKTTLFSLVLPQFKVAPPCFTTGAIARRVQELGLAISEGTLPVFRTWATQRLREYIVEGFALDDEQLKQGGTKNEYFDELLQRIREVRLSERNFYGKICDICQTSVDHDPRAQQGQPITGSCPSAHQGQVAPKPS